MDIEYDPVLLFKNANNILNPDIDGVDRYAKVSYPPGVYNHGETKFQPQVFDRLEDMESVKFTSTGNKIRRTPLHLYSEHTYEANSLHGTTFQVLKTKYAKYELYNEDSDLYLKSDGGTKK